MTEPRNRMPPHRKRTHAYFAWSCRERMVYMLKTRSLYSNWKAERGMDIKSSPEVHRVSMSKSVVLTPYGQVKNL